MGRFCKYAILTLVFAFGLSIATSATPTPAPCPSTDKNCKPSSAPEVDPALAISGLALLTGSLTVIRMRRRKK